eukprot:SAG11_NODE_23144_length_394_cov_1.044068_1_plen_43_part_10
MNKRGKGKLTHASPGEMLQGTETTQLRARTVGNIGDASCSCNP